MLDVTPMNLKVQSVSKVTVSEERACLLEDSDYVVNRRNFQLEIFTLFQPSLEQFSQVVLRNINFRFNF